MSQLDEATARYNKILESDPYRNLSWAVEMQKRRWKLKSSRLAAALFAPFLRPNFITRRQYDGLVKTGETLISAVDRMQQMVLESPALLARLELLPAEKMLAAIPPGYKTLEVTSRLDSHLTNGSLTLVQYNADSPTGVAWADGLSESCSITRRSPLRNFARSTR